MTHPVRQVFACVLFLSVPTTTAETAILQLQVLEGESAVQKAGARSPRPITVQVTDETGRPVENVAVSFRLPEEQVTGLFASGLRTEIVVSGADGRASIWGIHWGVAPGPVRIRVTAAKDQARAGTVVNQYVSESVVVADAPSRGTPGLVSGRGSGKWKWALIAAGVAGGGLAAGMARNKGSNGSSGPPPAAAAVTAVQVGPPTITVGQP
jgi:hypothetical protein